MVLPLMIEQGDLYLFNPISVISIFLLIITGVITILYYRRIRRAQQGYENAKEVIDDVIISFNKQLRKQEERMEAVTYKTQGLSSRSEEILKKIEADDRQSANLKATVKDISAIEEKFSARLMELDKKIGELTTAQEETTKKIEELGKVERKIPVMHEAKIEAVIPIRREKALAPLTETELHVLEILNEEGKKTAPEIRDRIKLTREHTARLMKKLYEGGYLERDSGKIPYAYSVKEEMQKILRKTEAKV
jgi:predicted transcriptional regulator